MSRVGHLVRAGFTLACLGLVAALGQIPVGGVSETSRLRLALRTVQAKVRTCRDRTPEELSALPRHMRTPTVCADLAPLYRLRVSIDGRLALDIEVAPGGLRGDRPLIVDRLLDVPPGEARVGIDFAPTGVEGLSPADRAVLPRYELDETLAFQPGRIALVTIDDQAGELTLYSDD